MHGTLEGSNWSIVVEQEHLGPDPEATFDPAFKNLRASETPLGPVEDEAAAQAMAAKMDKARDKEQAYDATTAEMKQKAAKARSPFFKSYWETKVMLRDAVAPPPGFDSDEVVRDLDPRQQERNRRLKEVGQETVDAIETKLGQRQKAELVDPELGAVIRVFRNPEEPGNGAPVPQFVKGGGIDYSYEVYVPGTKNEEDTDLLLSGTQKDGWFTTYVSERSADSKDEFRAVPDNDIRMVPAEVPQLIARATATANEDFRPFHFDELHSQGGTAGNPTAS